jgi:hypothetical protein
MTSINQIQPLKAEDDDSQGWDGTAFAAMADAYVRTRWFDADDQRMNTVNRCT